MKKRMLEKYTSRYDKVPSWLMIMLSCFIALGYFLISGFLSGIVVGIPMAIVLSFLVLNGNIQFQDFSYFLLLRAIEGRGFRSFLTF